MDLEGKPKGLRRVLRREVVHELARFLALIPLGFSDLRAPPSCLVTRVMLQPRGGGVCVTRGITPYGAAAALSAARGGLPEEHDFVPSAQHPVSLMGSVACVWLWTPWGCRWRAISLLKPLRKHDVWWRASSLTPSLSRTLSTSRRRCSKGGLCSTVGLAQYWWELGLHAKVSRASTLSVVGLSGITGAHFFHYVPRVSAMCKRHFPWAQVHNLTENVASMDYEDCRLMNEAYEEEPWFIDAAGVSLARRPRLYWISWELGDDEDVEVYWGSDGRLPIKGEVVLRAPVAPEKFLQPGWVAPESSLSQHSQLRGPARLLIGNQQVCIPVRSMRNSAGEMINIDFHPTSIGIPIVFVILRESIALPVLKKGKPF